VIHVYVAGEVVPAGEIPLVTSTLIPTCHDESPGTRCRLLADVQGTRRGGGVSVGESGPADPVFAGQHQGAGVVLGSPVSLNRVAVVRLISDK
jgi:hypothetical protein